MTEWVIFAGLDRGKDMTPEWHFMGDTFPGDDPLDASERFMEDVKKINVEGHDKIRCLKVMKAYHMHEFKVEFVLRPRITMLEEVAIEDPDLPPAA